MGYEKKYWYEVIEKKGDKNKKIHDDKMGSRLRFFLWV